MSLHRQLAVAALCSSAVFAAEPFAADYAKYSGMPGFKAFALAVDDSGAWATGYGYGAGTIDQAKQLAIQQCQQGVVRFVVRSPCRIIALGDERVAEVEWPDLSRGPSYEARWVDGTSFVIGSKDNLQLWVAFTIGNDPQALLFLANGGSEPITFSPEAIRAAATRTTRKGTTRTHVRVFGPTEYEKSVRTKQAWRAALHGAAVALSNQPRPRTTTFEGQQVIQQPGALPFHGSYTGTLTTWPSAADYAAANQRTAAQIQAMTGQLHASYDAMSSSLLRTHTLLPGTYYGGIVHLAKFKGDSILLEIPFGREVFRTNFSISK
jgi:hypothetical protein